MSEENENAVAVETEPKRLVDEHAEQVLEGLGFKPVPASLAEIYNDFKKIKDRMRPGRLSDEGFAFVVTLWAITGGK